MPRSGRPPGTSAPAVPRPPAAQRRAAAESRAAPAASGPIAAAQRGARPRAAGGARQRRREGARSQRGRGLPVPPSPPSAPPTAAESGVGGSSAPCSCPGRRQLSGTLRSSRHLGKHSSACANILAAGAEGPPRWRVGPRQLPVIRNRLRVPNTPPPRASSELRKALHLPVPVIAVAEMTVMISSRAAGPHRGASPGEAVRDAAPGRPGLLAPAGRTPQRCACAAPPPLLRDRNPSRPNAAVGALRAAPLCGRGRPERAPRGGGGQRAAGRREWHFHTPPPLHQSVPAFFVNGTVAPSGAWRHRRAGRPGRRLAGGAPRAPTQAAAAAGIKGSRRTARGTAARRQHSASAPCGTAAETRTAGKLRALQRSRLSCIYAIVWGGNALVLVCVWKRIASRAEQVGGSRASVSHSLSPIPVALAGWELCAAGGPGASEGWAGPGTGGRET